MWNAFERGLNDKNTLLKTTVLRSFSVGVESNIFFLRGFWRLKKFFCGYSYCVITNFKIFEALKFRKCFPTTKRLQIALFYALWKTCFGKHDFQFLLLPGTQKILERHFIDSYSQTYSIRWNNGFFLNEATSHWKENAFQTYNCNSLWKHSHYKWFDVLNSLNFILFIVATQSGLVYCKLQNWRNE